MVFISSWLYENQPSEVGSSIVHNDFKYDNLVLDKDDFSKISAVLDWEMATIGDPFMDLGTTLGYWVDKNDLPELKLFQLSATTLDGNPSREGILELYEKESGKSISNPVFYYVFGLFKIAVIAQQIYFRYKKGFTKDRRLLIRNTALESGDPMGFMKDEFKPNINFPVIFSSISPTLVTHIGNPEKFFFGGVNLQHISEIQFSRNLLLSTEFNARVYGNFDNTISGPGSIMEHVRTDLVEYLKEDDIVISRMQLDYVWSPRKDTYAKLSGGIYETMFAGYGIETLYLSLIHI